MDITFIDVMDQTLTRTIDVPTTEMKKYHYKVGDTLTICYLKVTAEKVITVNYLRSLKRLPLLILSNLPLLLIMIYWLDVTVL